MRNMKQYVKRITRSKVFLAGIAALLLYALAGFLLAPYLVARYVPRYAQEELGSQATMGHVSINPFRLRLEVRNFRLEHPPGPPIVTFDRLLVDFQLSSLFRQAWTFADVQIDGLDLNLEVQPDGSLNLAPFTGRLSKRYADVSSGEQPPRRWLLQHAQLRDGKLTFRDRSARTPVSASFAPINLEVLNLATLPDRHGRYAITATVPDGGSITWHGDISLLPTVSAGELEVKGLKLATVWAFVRDDLRLAEPKGSVDLATRYRFAYGNGEATLGLEGIRAQLTALALSASGGDPILALETITASEARFDLASRELVVPSIELAHGRVVVARGADGRISLVESLSPIGKPHTEAREPDPKAPSATRPWTFVLETVKLQGIELALADRSHEQPVTYDTTVVSATFQNITNDGKMPIRFEAALRAAQGGTVDSSGTIGQNLGGVEAQIEVSEVALAPLQPLLARYATLDVKSGHASASARVSYQTSGEGPSLRAIGSISIADLLVNESGTEERFLSWKTMSTDDVTFTLAPNRLRIKEIRVTEPGAKVAIFTDRTLNLAHVLKTDSRAVEPATATDRAHHVAASPPRFQRQAHATGAFSASVARVSVRNGTVDFADSSLVLPFSTRVTRFSGAAVGISTERTGRTEVKFRGRIEPSGSADVEGSLNAFDPKAFTDIHVRFDNVEMPPLSPYTATFAGRTVAAGRLSMELQYRVVNRMLASQNKVAMDHFTLGERVEAPKAFDLPLDLAIALLTDSHGRINVAVPINGDVGHPTFDYGRLVREAIADLIARVVSAPFRALARLFGSGDEEIGSIDFDPGRAWLQPPEREKLDKVAEALRQRGQLKLVVRGSFDPARDGEALRIEAVRREVAQALDVKLEGREDPGPMAYSDAATQKALEAMLVARVGPKGVEELARAFKWSSGRDPERVNRVLALFGRASPDREFYQAVFQRLVESYPLPESELEVLAARRAEVIVEYLVRSAGIAPSRMESGEARAVNAPSDRAVTMQLALDVLKAPVDAVSSARSDLEKTVPASGADLGAGGTRSRVDRTLARMVDPEPRAMVVEDFGRPR
jgi:Domain of Unknown Function (DUF748)